MNTSLSYVVVSHPEDVDIPISSILGVFPSTESLEPCYHTLLYMFAMG